MYSERLSANKYHLRFVILLIFTFHYLPCLLSRTEIHLPLPRFGASLYQLLVILAQPSLVHKDTQPPYPVPCTQRPGPSAPGMSLRAVLRCISDVCRQPSYTALYTGSRVGPLMSPRPAGSPPRPGCPRGRRLRESFPTPAAAIFAS